MIPEPVVVTEIDHRILEVELPPFYDKLGFQRYIIPTNRYLPHAQCYSFMTSSSSGLSEIDEWTDSETVDPTVYQVPIKTGDGPIRTNYQRTIIEGVTRDQFESIVDLPSSREK